MNEKDILTAYLGVTLALPSDKIAATLYKTADDGTITDEIQEGAIEALKALDKERISKVKPDTKQFFDNGYKKAQAEISEQFEKMIRDKMGVEDTDLKGEQLLIAGLEKVAKPKLEDEKVKLHPLFISREKELLAQIEAEKIEGQKALEEFKGQQTKSQRIAAAQARAKDILLSMKPVLEEDQRIADRRIKNFLNEFSSLEYEEVEGQLIPIKDGKRLENEHFHPVPFETLVKNWAGENFIFQVQDAKGSAGNQNQAGRTNTNGDYKFANRQEYESAYYAEKDQKKRSEMSKAYEDQNRPAS